MFKKIWKIVNKMLFDFLMYSIVIGITLYLMPSQLQKSYMGEKISSNHKLLCHSLFMSICVGKIFEN